MVILAERDTAYTTAFCDMLPKPLNFFVHCYCNMLYLLLSQVANMHNKT